MSFNLTQILNNKIYEVIRDMKTRQGKQYIVAKKATAESKSEPEPVQKRTVDQVHADVMSLISYALGIKNDKKIEDGKIENALIELKIANALCKTTVAAVADVANTRLSTAVELIATVAMERVLKLEYSPISNVEFLPVITLTNIQETIGEIKTILDLCNGLIKNNRIRGFADTVMDIEDIVEEFGKFTDESTMSSDQRILQTLNVMANGVLNALTDLLVLLTEKIQK